MCFAEHFQHFPDSGVRNIVVHIVRAVPGRPVQLLSGQAEAQFIRNDGIILPELHALRFHTCHQMVFHEEAQADIPGAADLRVRMLLQPIPGFPEEQIRKHPVPGSRHIQRIPDIKKEYFFVLQQPDHPDLRLFMPVIGYHHIMKW